MANQEIDERTREVGPRIARLLEEEKAEDVVILEVRELLPVCDYFIVATGRNMQHLDALSREVEEMMSSESGFQCVGQEGSEEGLWILMDYGSIIVHLFQEHVREYYRIEGLWADAPRIDYQTDE